MARISLVIATLGLTLLLGIATECMAEGAQPCSTAAEPAITSIKANFYPVKPLGLNSLRRRDLEFQWDSKYDTLGTSACSPNDLLTLEKLGITLAELPGHNPFGANLSDIHLVHEYFRAGTTPAYNTNPFAPAGLVSGQAESDPFSNPPSDGTVPTPSSERGHVDHYLSHPVRESGAQYPAEFYATKEDSSTGWWSVHPVTLDTIWTAWSTNSVQTVGPLNASAAARTDLDGTGWTRPGGSHNVAFVHEFQHSMPKDGIPAQNPIDEIFGLGAEAVAGNPLPPSRFDVSYVFGLISSRQQQHKWMFASYLAYNFRGTNLAATLTGFQDDLLYRWAKGDRHLYGLASLLSDANCAECSAALKPYFHPGGVPLDDHSRLQLLIHNWRVANYVNKSSLANGQYGFPVQFGFTPKDNAGAWQNLDPGASDVVVIPPEVRVGPSMAVRETTMVGTRYSAAGSLEMKLHTYGSEYWVVRADPALGATARDLVVRVSPEGIYRCFVSSLGVFRDFRLMASVVGYSVPADLLSTGQLWAHPEWAVQALDPIWVDVDSVAGGLEMVLPGFGTTVNAAVIVISLGDGPSAGWSGLEFQNEIDGIFPYRLSLALGTAPYLNPNPVSVLAGTSQIDESPTWSPAGDEIAFARRDAATEISAIYRKSLDGSPPVLLGTAGLEARSEPDWSPRGDWVAFSRQASLASTDAHIWVVQRWTQELLQLTTGTSRVDTSPAFEPNGQRIAYLRSWPQTSTPTQLRRVNLDGSGDILLATLNPPGQDGSPRWSPDGRFVYFARNGSLFAVPAAGGAPIPRPALITSAASFDLHSGQGPLLVGQAGVMTQTCTPAQPAVAFARIATRDTALNDTQARFYRTGASYLRPRWSPDGTRVAYSSNQNAADLPDRDLFIGQVSFNHAPSMLIPTADLIVHTGRPYELHMNASDPDGEALAYRSPSAFLPVGASFTEATRSFLWPSPGPVCSENYVVFRALDASGGVVSKVIKITAAIDSVNDLNSEVVGDNEIWLTWTAPGDNGALGRGVEYELRYAQVPLNEASFGLGTLVTGLAAPAVPGANESKVISALSPGTTYYIAIRTRDLKGNWSVLSNVLQVTTTTNGQQGGYLAQEVRLPLYGLRQAQTAVSRPGGTDASVLAVEMGLEGGARTWSIREMRADEIPALGLGDSTAVLLQARDAGGAWSDRARMRPEDAASRFAVRALSRPGRIVFVGSYGVRQAWNSVELDGRGGAARLVSAQHSRLGDVKGGFDARGTASLEVAAAESLSMVYEVVTQDSESSQDWYLLVGPPGSEVSTPAKAGSRGVSEGTRSPAAFSLRQNQPNPFSDGTTLRFDLPIETRVRLEIFDAQGRLVRTLADGGYTAGSHAVEWDHRADGGQVLGAGVYLYRIQAGTFQDQKKMVLLAR